MLVHKRHCLSTLRAMASLLLLACIAAVPASCRACADKEEDEEENVARDNFWRAQIRIVGKGSVSTSAKAFDCRSDGTTQTGKCGPTLLRFKELQPPLLTAIGAPGWRFDHWASMIRTADGKEAPRQGRMPDGRVYLNGFGYSDTGALDTVTPVFVPAPDGGDDLSTMARDKAR